jgi:hypothetical protein
MKATPEHPCRDCEFRHGGCQVECEIWHDYVKERDAVYAENKKEQILIAGYAENLWRNQLRAERRRHRRY